MRKLQNFLSFPRRRLCENSKTLCHSRGGGNPALMITVRDETNKALQYRHLSAVLTYLINGLDTRLRGYDKTFLHKLLRGYDKAFLHKLLRRNDNDRTEIKEKMGGSCLEFVCLLCWWEAGDEGGMLVIQGKRCWGYCRRDANRPCQRGRRHSNLASEDAGIPTLQL
ncbi:MAG: hypothetical protein RBS43_06090 [Candidatus Cloacimonas sp.]|nr:hypothetical protein [Candidatus Cloacimonas sp.]